MSSKQVKSNINSNQDVKTLNKELDAMNRLHDISTLFIHKDNWNQVLTKIVETAIAISGADFGNIQLLDDDSSRLNIVAHQGFPKWWLEFWNEVHEGEGVCGTALETGKRVIVEDVEQSPIFIGTPALDVQLKAGVHAVQSTPIYSRDGKPLGMFSTHFKIPHRPDERELKLLDLLANQVADIVERKKAEDLNKKILEELRNTETLLSSITNLSSEVIYIKDNQSRWIFVNPALERIIGRTADEVLGKNDSEIYSNQEIAKIILDNDKKIMESGKETTLEEIVELQGEQHSFISVKAPRFDLNGNVIGIVGISHDITDIKNTENALKESEDRYRSIFNNMLNGFAFCKMIYENGHPIDFTYLEVNKSFEKLTGLRNVIGKNVSEVIPNINESDPELLEIYGRVAITGQQETFEMFLESLNMWFSVSVYSPKKEYFVAVFDVITDRKLAEKQQKHLLLEFQNKKEELSALIENIVDEVWFCDVHGEIILANAAARKFEQETEQENIKSLNNLISSVEVYNTDGSVRSREGSPLIRALNGEIIFDFEEIVVFPSTGKKVYRNVTSAPIKDNNNKITGAVAVVRDITDRKKIESELDMYRKNLERLVLARTAELENAIRSLKESEEHYLTLFNSIDEGFCTIEVIFDSNNKPIDYRFLEINPAFSKQTGLEDAEGKLMRDLAPDHEEHWFEIYGKIALTGKPMRFVNPAKALNKWYDVYAFKVGGPESREVAILFNDITKFKNLEKELRQYQDTLEEKVKKRTEALTESNKELEQFAYITSHDLREPLRMITSFLQLLERRYKDQLDEDANEFIGFAVEGAKRLDAMTNDLLLYSRITREKSEMKPVNFEHVLEHTLENLKVQIEENHAEITHDPLPTIHGDEKLKVQLFQNIIGNAIKYRSHETPKIHISAKKENNQYLFSIKDNGIGMSPKHSEQIFTIFKRLHTHEEYEGTGIGLAIAYKIVHQQGGQIWVESELGNGSTFYFTIPIKT